MTLPIHSQEVDSALSNYTSRPAIFKVTANVVNENVEPFTVTAPSFGNTLKRAGKGNFEPAEYRTIIYADEDSVDQIISESSSGIQFYDSYASGYLDGATVQVYRIMNGELTLVREDRVIPGGTVIESWSGNSDSKVIDPKSTQAEFAWADWSRPNAERWFTVYAVDTSGNRSEPAKPVKVVRQQKDKNANAETKEIRFKANPQDETAPPAPRNFQAKYNAEGILVMTWDPVDVDDLVGYQVSRTDTNPASHRGIYLQLEKSPRDPPEQIKKGDMIIVSKSLVHFTPSWLSNRIGNLGTNIVDGKKVPLEDIVARPTTFQTSE